MSSPLLLDGRLLAKSLRTALKERVQALSHVPTLRILRVGDQKAQSVYIAQKLKRAALLGIDAQVITLPEEVTAEQIITTFQALNTDSTIDGYILQLPLPAHLSLPEILPFIDPKKDVDGLHPRNQGGIQFGNAYFLPCTPSGIVTLLEAHAIPIIGSHIVIINRSSIVGMPLCHLLLRKGATVTVCHSQTQDLPSHTRSADMVISAVGQAKFITGSMLSPGVHLVDVGCDTRSGVLAGDLDLDTCLPLAASYTPMPGGVGPMTVHMLMANTVSAAERKESLS